MICRECGANIDDNATECRFCGAVYGENEPVEEKNSVVTEAETAEVITEKDEIEELFDENEAKRRLQMEKIRAEKQSKLDEIEKRRLDKKRRQRRNRILVILLVLLCAGAIAAGVYYIGPTSGGNDDDVVIVTQRPTQTPEATPETTQLPTVEPVTTDNPDQTAEPTDNVTVTNKPVTSSKATPVPQKNTVTSVTAKPAATKKPVTTTAKGSISSALVTGGEVVKSNGKTYMSFNYNGSVQYAKVSDNTTTNFISGKPMTISAYKTSEVYNGQNVYAITRITHYNGTYIFPTSGSKILTEADLAGKTANELRLGRNEIYARHGRKFNDSSLQSYFNSCSWYKAKSSYNYSNDSANLNSIEKKNINIIKEYENKLK